ncbi:7TM diverse intracellular signaling domain-containing protein [Spirosoma soli]|uniref:histidine kinase n=1 Tax=Spirosoma soli TaxID=1770529 RepID=A0ABW5M4N6_9BACT
MRLSGWFTGLWLGVLHALSAQPVLRIDPSFKESFLVGYMTRLDSSRALSATGLRLQFSHFRPVTESVVNYGSDPRHHYLRFTLYNSGPEPRRLILNLQQLFFEQANLFLYDPSGQSLVKEQYSSWRIPVARRPLPYRLHNFLIELPPRQTVTAVLHTRVSPRQRTSKALVGLYDEQAFLIYDANELLVQGLLYGSILLVFCFGLTFLITARQAIYGFYCLYTGSQLGYILNINGIFGQLSDQTGWLSDPVFGGVMALFSSAFHISFYLRFMHFEDFAPAWLWKLMNGLIIGTLLVASYMVLQPEQPLPFLLATSIVILYVCLLVGCLGWSIYHRRSEVRVIGLALTPMLLLWIYYLLSGRVLPVYRFLFVFAFYPVLVFEMITLGVSLVYRFNSDRQRIMAKLAEATQENTRQVMLAQEEERQQIAANLHDDLGGTLATLQREIAIQNERFGNQLLTALSMAQQATVDLRLIAHHLMPTIFSQKGLQIALQEAVELADRQSTARVLFVCSGAPRRLNPELEINAYRIVRELLTNALKHAQATRIVVQLIFYHEFLYTSVEDDGPGFSSLPHYTDARGIGLKNVRLRATYLQATLNIETNPSGTLITLEIPYDTSYSTHSHSVS